MAPWRGYLSAARCSIVASPCRRSSASSHLRLPTETKEKRGGPLLRPPRGSLTQLGDTHGRRFPHIEGPEVSVRPEGKASGAAERRNQWAVQDANLFLGLRLEEETRKEASTHKMGELEISSHAYLKMCLHAARYPNGAVNGVLLARRPHGGRSECLCVTDCVPLFHSNLSLALGLEVALNQIDMWSLTQDLILAGYYQANAALDDKNASNVALRTAGRLSEYFSDAILIMLDNRRLSPDPPLPPVIIQQHKDKRWIPKDKNLIMWQNWEQTRRIWKALLESKAYKQLVDFDAHLDDIRADWTNQYLNGEIVTLASVANGNA